MKKHRLFYLYILVFLGLACNFFSLTGVPQQATPTLIVPTPEVQAPKPMVPTPEVQVPVPTVSVTTTSIVTTNIIMGPAESLPLPGEPVYDVDSSGTGAQRFAPYGDSYRFNRFERPFLADMIYVQDLDIVSFNLSEDVEWYYVSINLVGNNPNNALGINYGVEIDLKIDGFGDYIIWAHPPYTPTWNTTTVQVFQDSNNDSAGLSATLADGVISSNGYDALIYDGESPENTTPGLAWVRFSEDQEANVQFAFQKNLVGSSFRIGVVSDAGLKDVSIYDYNDHFEEFAAGSPIKDKEYYPLGVLYAVDNTCWAAYGYTTTGNEPKACPVEKQKQPSTDSDEPAGCNPIPQCGGGGYDPVTCQCL